MNVDSSTRSMERNRDETEAQARGDLTAGVVAIRVLLILAVLYVFLVSIGLMGAGFKIFGKDFAKMLIETTSNPFVGLFIGIFATALIQSSSTTTSMVVAFVASGTLTVENAIPVVMGANVGTAVTAALVSLGHMTRRAEFKRAYAAAMVHDIFNLLAVAVFLPIELATGYLSKSAHALSGLLAGTAGVEFKSPLKLVTQPVCEGITDAIVSIGLADVACGVIVVVLGVAVLVVSLIFLSKLLKSLVLSKLERFFERSIGRSGFVAMLIGMCFTAIVQSSSVTTSLMVPMAAAGIMTLRQVFPVTLGANVGTTVTAILASLATGRPEALTIALVHLLFNLSGILLFYPLNVTRQIPLRIARWIAVRSAVDRFFSVGFIIVVYFVIPGVAILATR